ncbi:MAG: DUF2334 domain-containing protein [Elusimicrobiaceae bacterium]|nr:DUF2334 domain-containing protein [Elusimicrobiaceae bacterium]
MPKILIRFDDICPTMNWAQWDRAVEVLNKYGVKPLLGVVPDCQDPILHIDPPRPDFWEYIKKLQKQGWTLAMHGYQHHYDNIAKGLITRRGNTEFAGHPYQLQYEKIKKGKAILESHGIFTDIFFAPSHSYDENTLKALAANGFNYLSDGKTLRAIKRHGIICLPCRGLGSSHFGEIYTNVFHAHEWSRPEKASGFHELCNLCTQHVQNIVDFEHYKKQPLGWVHEQIVIEKIFILWQYYIYPSLTKMKFTSK